MGAHQVRRAPLRVSISLPPLLRVGEAVVCGGRVFTGHGSSAWVPRFPTRALPPAMLSFPGGTGSLRLESWQLTCPHPDGALTRVSVVLSTQ